MEIINKCEACPKFSSCQLLRYSFYLRELMCTRLRPQPGAYEAIKARRKAFEYTNRLTPPKPIAGYYHTDKTSRESKAELDHFLRGHIQ